LKINSIFLIAGIALFIALGDVPYAYYQLLRFFICGVGAYGAYLTYQQKKTGWTWILGIVALIFNPFVKFHLAKEAWKFMDFIGGMIFLVYFFKGMKSELKTMKNDKEIKDYDLGILTTESPKKNIFKRFFKGMGTGSLIAGGGILYILFSILQFAFTAIVGLGMIGWAINAFSKGSIIVGLLVLLIGTPLAIGFSYYAFFFLLILAILSAIVWGIAHIFGFSISFASAGGFVWTIIKVLILGMMAFVGVTGLIEAIKEKRPLYFFKEYWLGILLFCFLFWLFFL